MEPVKVKYSARIFYLSFVIILSLRVLTAQESPYITVLGIAQDGGYPQSGCLKDCCINLWDNPSQSKHVSSLAIVSPNQKAFWIVDATPDFPAQLNYLYQELPNYQLAGIFLTHAHIGHYSGLVHLGREVMGLKDIPVFVMPKMKEFLQKNGPWSQLVSLKNIKLIDLKDRQSLLLANDLSIQPISVPHRDEFSETVAYQIQGKQSLFYIPDIDKWEKWDQDIQAIAQENSFTLIDGTFYDTDELPGRDMSEIPHPFIVESMRLLQKHKKGIYFIHLNHSNPLLNEDSKKYKEFTQKGFNIAKQGQKFDL